MSGSGASGGGQGSIGGIMDAVANAIGITSANPGPGMGGPSASSPAGGAQAAGGHTPGTGTPSPGAPGNAGQSGGMGYVASTPTTATPVAPKPATSGLTEQQKLEEARRRAAFSSSAPSVTKVLLGT